jgi:hypothetical protein
MVCLEAGAVNEKTQIWLYLKIACIQEDIMATQKRPLPSANFAKAGATRTIEGIFDETYQQYAFEPDVGGGSPAPIGLNSLTGFLVVDKNFDESTPDWGVKSFSGFDAAVEVATEYDIIYLNGYDGGGTTHLSKKDKVTGHGMLLSRIYIEAGGYLTIGKDIYADGTITISDGGTLELYGVAKRLRGVGDVTSKATIILREGSRVDTTETGTSIPFSISPINPPGVVVRAFGSHISSPDATAFMNESGALDAVKSIFVNCTFSGSLGADSSNTLTLPGYNNVFVGGVGANITLPTGGGNIEV